MKSFLLFCTIIFSLSFFSRAGRIEHLYRFANPLIENIGEYQALTFNNALLTSLQGQPVLPYARISLMLPPGESATDIEIIFNDEIALPGWYTLYPQQEVLPTSEQNHGTLLKDNAVYSKNEKFPENQIGKLQTSFLNGRSFALSSFTPVRYNPVSGKISYYSSALVVVKTASDPKAVMALSNLTSDKTRAVSLADNAENEKLYQLKHKRISSEYELLIISTTEYSDKFSSLVSAYLQQGLKSKITTLEDITSSMPGIDNPEKIRNYIIQEYQQHGIQYVLLAGDVELIPFMGFYCYVQSGSGYTDNNITF